MTMQSTAPQSISHIPAEHILVVKRATLFPDGTAWHGLKQIALDDIMQLIQTHQEFYARPLMETDPTYKQIIPYLIFKHEDRYFLMQRSAQASEKRLQNKYSLGIGGHVRYEDLQNGASLFDWARREFHEEIAYEGNLTISTLGIINDDTNEVGKVHIGLALLLEGDSANISIRSELQSGKLLSITECAAHYDNLESWSAYIFDYLKTLDQ